VNLLAIAALAELGIDPGAHVESVDTIDPATVDTVDALCRRGLGLLGKARRIHWPLPDPAGAEGSDEERLARFRDVRDEIRRRLPSLLAG
jgi:arsenate reductase